MTAPSPTASLLDRTLAAATRDRQMVTSAGQRIGRLTDGVEIRPLTTHSDARGSIVELFDLVPVGTPVNISG